MKKNEKINISYAAPAPTASLITSLKAADEADLLVLLTLALHKDNEELDLEAVRTSLELSDEEFAASIKYWRGAGILKKSKATATAQKTEKKLERAEAAPSYSSSELVSLIEKRKVTTEFIDNAQRIMGRMFSTRDMNTLIGMVEYIGFDEDCVLEILSYIAGLEKKTLKYAESIAYALYDEGITDKAALTERLEVMKKARSVRGKVEAMFGMTGRALTAREKKFLTAWTETMRFDEEVIKLAYDITVDNTHEPSVAYANSILDSWHKLGLRTADEVKAEIEKGKSAKKSAKAGSAKSFDTDEFFEAALKRSLEEL